MTMADNDHNQSPEGSSSGSARRRGRRPGGGGGSGEGRAGKPEATDPSKLRFFTLIPEATNIDFVGNRRKGLLLSLILVLLSFGLMGWRTYGEGQALN